MLCNASYHERLILLAQYNTACFYISEEKNKKLHYQICKKWPVFFFSFVHSAYMQDIQHLQRQIYIYICISLVCTKIWRNMRRNGKVCFCLQGGGNSSDGNWQSQPKSMGNRSLCENCMILQHCVVLTTSTERERILQTMSSYNFPVESWWHWYDRVWRSNCCGGVGMVHLNWKLYKLHESFVKKHKICRRNFALFGMVCNGIALHNMICSGKVW